MISDSDRDFALAELGLPEHEPARIGAPAAARRGEDLRVKGLSDEASREVDPADESADQTSTSPDDSPAWLARIASGVATGVASTGRFIWDIPGQIGSFTENRRTASRLRHEDHGDDENGTDDGPPPPAPNTVPLGARQVSPGYADDLWQARPTLDRPYPVILIHGTISSKNVWQNLVHKLRADGFVVFCPDYGTHGTQDIPTSAEDVGAYIEQVLFATGADQVDIVGHSQGGLLARYWINELDGAEHVHHLISLGSPHHGTTLFAMLGVKNTAGATYKMAAAAVRRIFGEAGMQQVAGSPILDTLAASPDTRPGVLYTNFATTNDSTVVPTEHAFLSQDELAPVNNHYLQDLGVSKVKHEELPGNDDVQQLIHQALVDGLTSEHSDDWVYDDD